MNRPRVGGAASLWQSAYAKCFFANARPEPLLRYFSKATALAPVLNCIETTSCHGRSMRVCCEPPELCVASLFSISPVRPE
jgi:hypothetical protein